MIVARVTELLFVENDHVHTVAYDRRARSLIKQFSIEGRGLDLVVAVNVTRAFEMLQAQLEAVLCSKALDPKDFAFRIGHSDVSELGYFKECTWVTTHGTSQSCNKQPCAE